MLEYTYENEVMQNGYKLVCGIDEAGRGPLSGPVVAAACILPFGLVIDGLNDSKKISPKKRELLFDKIKEEALAWGIGLASPAEIDELNILAADMLAMRRAIDDMEERFSINPDYLLIDGNYAKGFSHPLSTIVKGDSKSPSVAAASILAKVTRDRICDEHDKEYPEYGFARHKGYSTKEHMEKVRELGVLPIHRKTFLKFLDKK
jgi:ribonuclease HII